MITLNLSQQEVAILGQAIGAQQQALTNLVQNIQEQLNQQLPAPAAQEPAIPQSEVTKDR